MEQRLTRLEVEVSHLTTILELMQKDVRHCRDALVGAKGAGRALLGVIGLLGAGLGWVAKSWIH